MGLKKYHLQPAVVVVVAVVAMSRKNTPVVKDECLQQKNTAVAVAVPVDVAEFESTVEHLLAVDTADFSEIVVPSSALHLLS